MGPDLRAKSQSREQPCVYSGVDTLLQCQRLSLCQTFVLPHLAGVPLLAKLSYG